MLNKIIYDVLVIGAGPAGLMAALKSGQRSLHTIVVEKKSHPCIKLSITGKGRCNFTNSASVEEFIKLFRNGKFLYNAFYKFSNFDAVSFFEQNHIVCKLERGGRYFPASGKALDIANVLIKQTKLFSEIVSSFCVKSVVKIESGFVVLGDNKEIFAKNIIVATGGLSYPQTGSTGDGYKIAKSFGHTIIDTVAALVPIIIDSKHLKSLNGLKLKNVEASLIIDGVQVAKEFGEMEFTIFGMDGPVILTLSGLIAQNVTKQMHISINLKPALTNEQIEQRLIRELEKFGKYQLKDMLKELLPIQLIKPFIDMASLQMTKKCSQINKKEREKILATLIALKFKVVGAKDIKEAIVTRGGISTNEIDQKTMQSKIVKGLYFCGEVIDIDAPTGGFNLQAAFSTGFLAGISVGK
jgi:predicted Rossmann fold flavoprotein